MIRRYRRALTVVPRLALLHVECVVAPPAYAGQPALIEPLDSAPITVVYGSTVSLKLTFNKSLCASEPIALQPEEAGGALPAVTWNAASGPTTSGQWIATASTVFQVKAVDSDGLPNADMDVYQVIVRPDSPPTVQITQPGE